MLRETRDEILDAAIQICEQFASAGHNAECCVQALRDLKGMLPKTPHSEN